tara:strand:+ start:464 stop:724 length:261 start_codon:yes stop_codon:yes gene_type:complete
MRITKRQLRRIIKEEKARLLSENPGIRGSSPSDPEVYEEAETQALAIVEDIFNNYGPDPLTVESVVQALQDVANMVQNDDRLTQGY